MAQDTAKALAAHSSSFRDPAGFIFTYGGHLYRQINQTGKADFDQFINSGLYDVLIQRKLLIPHTIVQKTDQFGASAERYTVIQPEEVPFISYPYEWSFAQLKDAALMTLRIQSIALEHGMILKDASAYNVQFIGKEPVFIDTLSFTAYTPGMPWDGYRQFCEQFVAPLALARYTSYDSLRLLQTHIEGLPLKLACSLLPLRAKLNRSLLSHLYLHSASQRRFEHSGNQTRQVKPRSMSTFALDGLLASLNRTVRTLKPPKSQTEWGDYYSFTNYSEAGFKEKQTAVKDLLGRIQPQPKLVWDLGANNGEFSQLAAERGAYTVAFDIDPIAVGRNYLHRDAHKTCILPLIQDFTNPSPALGFLSRERDSLFQRGPADVVMALALIHHLAIGRNLPLARIAEFLAATGKHVIIEFVPKDDSKVQILLASRKDIFPQYDIEHFEAAMATYFTLTHKQSIKHTKRTLYLFTAKKI